MDKKRINVTTMQNLSIEECNHLLNTLQQLDEFEFFIDLQLEMNYGK